MKNFNVILIWGKPSTMWKREEGGLFCKMVLCGGGGKKISKKYPRDLWITPLVDKGFLSEDWNHAKFSVM